MKNFEKYKTAEEASRAFLKLCYKHDGYCEMCPVNIKNGNESDPCSFEWFYLDEDEE